MTDVAHWVPERYDPTTRQCPAMWYEGGTAIQCLLPVEHSVSGPEFHDCGGSMIPVTELDRDLAKIHMAPNEKPVQASDRQVALDAAARLLTHRLFGTTDELIATTIQVGDRLARWVRNGQ